MTDPTDFKAIDDVGFVTGHVIQPYIAPDIDISWALGTYYQLGCDQNGYQMIADLCRKQVASQPAKTPNIPNSTETGELLNVTIPAELEGFTHLNSEMQHDINRLPNDVNRYTVDRLSMDFAGACTRDDVANIFINYLGHEFTTGALFIVHDNSVVGWRGVSRGERVTAFADLSLSLSNPSIIRDVVESRNFSLGILNSTPDNWKILNSLNIHPETSLLVLPVVMMNKVVVVVLVMAEMEDLGRPIAELQKLVRKASLAFEMLIIKNKILIT
jgi:hypothetical protein